MAALQLNSIHLTGLRLSHKTSNENQQSSRDCGDLWQKFEQEHVQLSIPNRVSDEIYAVYFDYEGDHTKPFAYFIGCRMQPGTSLPEGLQSLTIPEQHYRLIHAKGQMPDCVSNAWKNIWKASSDRAYGYDFEVYGAKSSDWNNAEVEIYVSCK